MWIESFFKKLTSLGSLAKPCEGFRKLIFCFNQSPGYGKLVNKHVVDVFKLSTKLDSVDRRAEFTLIEKELKLKKG